MGIVHHANYVRYLELARIVWMDEHDRPYREYMADGLHFSTTRVDLRYVRSAGVRRRARRVDVARVGRRRVARHGLRDRTRRRAGRRGHHRARDGGRQRPAAPHPGRAARVAQRARARRRRAKAARNGRPVAVTARAIAHSSGRPHSMASGDRRRWRPGRAPAPPDSPRRGRAAAGRGWRRAQRVERGSCRPWSRARSRRSCSRARSGSAAARAISAIAVSACTTIATCGVR